MSRLPLRPRLVLNFTILTSADQVRLVAGEDFRFTLTGSGLERWLPTWLEQLDGSRSVEEALRALDPIHHQTALQLLERLAGERLLMDGGVDSRSLPQPLVLVPEGTGVLRDALNHSPQASVPAVRVLCQDRLDLDEVLAFNERCLARRSDPWLWVSCAAGSRGYVSPLILPDAGPCLACLWGHFRRLSPFPELYDELIEHARHGGKMVPTPFPRPGVAILARLVEWKAELASTTDVPGVVYRLHVLEARTLEISSHTVLLDPECPACRGRR